MIPETKRGKEERRTYHENQLSLHS